MAVLLYFLYGYYHKLHLMKSYCLLNALWLVSPILGPAGDPESRSQLWESRVHALGCSRDGPRGWTGLHCSQDNGSNLARDVKSCYLKGMPILSPAYLIKSYQAVKCLWLWTLFSWTFVTWSNHATDFIKNFFFSF